MKNILDESTGYKIVELNNTLSAKMLTGEVTSIQLEHFLSLSFNERQEKFGIVIDPWFEQKTKLIRFYKEVFGKDISFEGVKMPECKKDFPTLGFIDRSITGKQMIQAYKRLFGDDSVYGNDYSKDIDKMIKEQQSRIEGNYAFAHVGAIEPDKLHLKKSYDDFHNDGNSYMIPLEGIMFALQYRFETGNMLDVKGVTRFHALVADGNVLYMFHDGFGQFFLGYHDRGYRLTDYGPRQVNF